jgi:uncharacterized protein (DUF2062 family)
VSVSGLWHFASSEHDLTRRPYFDGFSSRLLNGTPVASGTARVDGPADDGNRVIRRLESQARKLIATLLKERLDPCRAAAAVFSGIFIGIIPIYGLQTLAAVGVAFLFRLNKPLTVAGTFISNPLLQPLIVFSSVELGCFLRHGSFQPLSLSALASARSHITREQLVIWVMGSAALGLLLGGLGAAVTAVIVHLHQKGSRTRSCGSVSAL